MSIHRRDARRDSNEAAIVAALKSQGFHVTRISGAGVPDLLVSKRCNRFKHGPTSVLCWGENMCWLVEVKTPKGRYQAAQLAFKEAWQGPPIITLRSVEDALKFQVLAMEGA